MDGMDYPGTGQRIDQYQDIIGDHSSWMLPKLSQYPSWMASVTGTCPVFPNHYRVKSDPLGV